MRKLRLSTLFTLLILLATTIPAKADQYVTGLVISRPASTIIPGATSLSLRNHANSADNFICLDAGTCTVRAGLTVTAGGATVTGATTITSTSANALAVGPNGTTNPTLRVDASAVSADAGLSIASGIGTSATMTFLSASGVAPNVGLTLSGKNNGAITLSSPTNITSNSANAFDVGPNGATNPTFQVDGSAVSAATGLRIRAAAPGGNVFVDTISQNANEALVFTSKGAAGIIFQTNTNGRNVFGMADVASAVNYLQVAGGPAGSGPVLSAQGSDTNVSLNLTPKGTGSVNITSTSVSAQAVGPNGATNPTLQVDGSVAGETTGILIRGRNGGVSEAAEIHAQGSTNTNLLLITPGSGSITMDTAGGVQFNVAHTASSVNYLQATGAATGNGPTLSAQGTDTNIPILLSPKASSVVIGPVPAVISPNQGDLVLNRGGASPGTGALYFGSSNQAHYIFFGSSQFQLTDRTFIGVNSVNYLDINGQASGNAPYIAATGGDTDIGLRLSSKGAGSLFFNTESNGVTQFQITDIPLAKNVVQVTGGVAGSGPVISAVNANGGTDTNVPLNLSPKGTGTVNVNGPLSTTGVDATFGVGLRSSASSNSNIVGRFWSTAAAPTNDLFQVKSTAASGPGFNLLNMYASANSDGTAGTSVFSVRGDGKITTYNNVATVGMGVPILFGGDNRTGLTSTDGAATTLYTTTGANQLYRITADIYATAAVTGTANYTITWTEHSTTQTLVVNSTTLDVNASSTALIRPDSGTNITGKFTAGSAGTFSVAGIIEKIV